MEMSPIWTQAMHRTSLASINARPPLRRFGTFGISLREGSRTLGEHAEFVALRIGQHVPSNIATARADQPCALLQNVGRITEHVQVHAVLDAFALRYWHDPHQWAHAVRIDNRDGPLGR